MAGRLSKAGLMIRHGCRTSGWDTWRLRTAHHLAYVQTQGMFLKARLSPRRCGAKPCKILGDNRFVVRLLNASLANNQTRYTERIPMNRVTSYFASLVAAR